MRYPTRFQQKTLWNAATGVSMLILGMLVVGMVWLIGKVFGFLQPVLIPLIVAAIIAFVIDPVVKWLEKHGCTRLWAVVIVYAAMLGIITLLVAAVLPGIQRGHVALKSYLSTSSQISDSQTEERKLGETLTKELVHLRESNQTNLIGWLLTEIDDNGEVVDSKPALETTMSSPNKAQVDTPPTTSAVTLDSFANSRGGRLIIEYKGTIFNTGRAWLSAGSSKLIGFLGLVLGMLMVPVYLFFFLKESAAIRKHWHDYVPIKASRFKTGLVETLQEINGYLISFFRGQVLVAAIDGVLVGITLTIFGLPYGLLIGIFMAILGVIPYIGNILCLVPACVIGYLHAQGSSPFGLEPWPYVGCVVAIFVVVQQINSLVTAPKIVGDSVGLHPLTVIFSMLFWSLVLGGFVGTLLAVPMTAAVKVLFRRFIWERQLHELSIDVEPTTPV